MIAANCWHTRVGRVEVGEVVLARSAGLRQVAGNAFGLLTNVY